MSLLKLNNQQYAIVIHPLELPLKVIAGAGTGKTQTITERFIYLVEKFGILPSEILAITFTEKAAEEMAIRIRDRLKSEEELYISTFHSFSARMLREYSYEVGYTEDFKIIEEVGREVFLHRLLSKIVNGEYLDYPMLNLDNLINLPLNVKDFLFVHTPKVIAKVKALGLSPERLLLRIKEINNSWARFIKSSAHTEMPGKSWTAFRQKNSLEELEQQFRKEMLYEEKLMEIIAQIYTLYQELLEEEDCMDFDDLILKFIFLLNHFPYIRLEVQRQFKYIIVDEFQDSNIAQQELLRLLIPFKNCTFSNCPVYNSCHRQLPVRIMIVGDKKQSIYGFRYAHPENMDELIPCSIPEIEKPLIVNYRSAEVIIEDANRVKRTLYAKEPDIVPHNKQAFKEIAHNGELCPICSPYGGVGAEPCVRLIPGREINETSNALSFKYNEREEDEFIIREIKELLKEGYSFCDFAILLRKKKRFLSLKQGLQKEAIPYKESGDLGFFLNPLVKDWLAYLKVCMNLLEDFYLVRILLRPPWALSQRELLGMIEEKNESGKALIEILSERESLSPLWRVLTKLYKMQLEKSGEEVFNYIMEFFKVYKWGKEEEELKEKFFRFFQFFEKQMGKEISLGEFLEALSLYQEDEGSVLPLESVEKTVEAISIMTVHKAKGLEFTVVFLPSFYSKPRQNISWNFYPEWGFIINELDGQQTLKRKLIEKNKNLKETLEKEALRLEYVAITRARKLLYRPPCNIEEVEKLSQYR